ncbi:hypothetical protein ABZT02_23660 [Streptomyces sp. NPDC005402]|uniref:hypothetical protein n=1 Tax=Streptomyces sp. NPDC005402 TaxID=3155338 RepID=UPI0033A3DE05
MPTPPGKGNGGGKPPKSKRSGPKPTGKGTKGPGKSGGKGKATKEARATSWYFRRYGGRVLCRTARHTTRHSRPERDVLGLLTGRPLGHPEVHTLGGSGAQLAVNGHDALCLAKDRSRAAVSLSGGANKVT